MASATLNNSNITLNCGGNITGVVTDNGTTATFNPSSNLPYSIGCNVSVSTAVTDVAGNNMASVYNFSFTTQDPEAIPPTISSINPSNGATDISPSSAITITFSEDMKSSTINSANIYLEDSGFALVPATVNLSGNVVTVTPNSSMALNDTHTLNITTGVQDLVGNALQSSSSTTFTTSASSCVQTSRPTICYSTPANGSNLALIDSTVKIRFTEVMDASTINSTNIYINGKTATVSQSGVGHTVTLTPSTDFASNTPYTVTIKSATKGSETGQTFASDTTFTFTTSSGDDNRDAGNTLVNLPNSGLAWQDDSAITTKRTWEDAKTYCSSLNKGGFNDWRVPRVSELKALQRTMNLDTTLFSNTQDGYFWSSETFVGDSLRAHDVKFNSGTVGHYSKINSNYTRCVRSDLGQETATDGRANSSVTLNATGLVWQDDTAVKTNQQAWTSAVSYCSALNMGGSTDWRLPTISELETIVDTQVTVAPHINSLFVNNGTNSGYWSSTEFNDPRYGTIKAIILTFMMLIP